MIIVITGPTSAGKSTVGKALCQKFDKCVRIDIDRVKHFVESGFVYDNSDAGKKQWALCIKNTIALAKNFIKEDYSIVVEGYLNYESPGWDDILQALPVDKAFLLLPSKEVLLKRNLQRAEKMQMEEDEIDMHSQYFSKHPDKDTFTILDTSGLSVEETVSKIMSV